MQHLYLREFPDFDAHGDAQRALAAGFTDVSWHNDACPCFEKECDYGNAYQLYIDYANPELSETGGSPLRFSVQVTTDDLKESGHIVDVATSEEASHYRRGWYAKTRAAKPEEYADLLAELRDIYETGEDAVQLVVKSRARWA